MFSSIARFMVAGRERAVGLDASVTSAIQMKVELLDTYKTRPPSATVVSNDVAVVLSFLYKFD